MAVLRVTKSACVIMFMIRGFNERSLQVQKERWQEYNATRGGPRIVLFKYLKFAASASRLKSLGLVGVESGSVRSNGPTNMWAELRGSAADKLLAG